MRVPAGLARTAGRRASPGGEGGASDVLPRSLAAAPRPTSESLQTSRRARPGFPGPRPCLPSQLLPTCIMALLATAALPGRSPAPDTSRTSVITALLWSNRMEGATKEYPCGGQGEAGQGRTCIWELEVQVESPEGPGRSGGCFLCILVHAGCVNISFHLVLWSLGAMFVPYRSVTPPVLSQ